MLTDNGTPKLSSTTRVVITVADVNDNGPEFQQKFYKAQIPATAKIDDKLYQVRDSLLSLFLSSTTTTTSLLSLLPVLYDSLTQQLPTHTSTVHSLYCKSVEEEAFCTQSTHHIPGLNSLRHRLITTLVHPFTVLLEKRSLPCSPFVFFLLFEPVPLSSLIQSAHRGGVEGRAILMMMPHLLGSPMNHDLGWVPVPRSAQWEMSIKRVGAVKTIHSVTSSRGRSGVLFPF